MVAAVCIACKETFDIGSHPKKGQLVTCPHCQSDWEVIRVKPPLLDWPIFINEYGGEGLNKPLANKRTNKHSQKTLTFMCISCDEPNTISGHVKIGQYVYCDECYAELEVVGLSPLRVDWPESDSDYLDYREDDIDIYQDQD